MLVLGRVCHEDISALILPSRLKGAAATSEVPLVPSLRKQMCNLHPDKSTTLNINILQIFNIRMINATWSMIIILRETKRLSSI